MPFLFISPYGYTQSWQLVWQDEFTNAIGPDWVFETGTGSGGWGNNELQYYRQQNASVSNGQLVITARRESFGGMQYTSARMKTQGRKSWRYGRIEARIAIPAFQGVWPAFWMLGDNITSVGWPACGEIDVMEHINTGGNVHGTMHWQDHNNNYANYGGSTSTTVTNFHVYSIEWTPSYIRWFVDGVQYHEADITNGVNGTHEFHNNHFIILNMAIGGNWPGFTVDNNAFPANMYVDYVRVYQQTSQPSAAVTVYQHCNYGGYAVGLPVGNYTLSDLQSRGIINDDISSVRVQSGYQVRLFQNNSYGGSSVLKSGDDACLVDDGFNDATTSIQVALASPSFSMTVQAENFTAMNGVQTEGTSDTGGGLNVGWIDTNDWMAYGNINIPATGSYLLEYRVASPGGGRLSQDLNSGSIVLGQVNVPATGGWQNWTTISQTVNINAGTYSFGIFAAQGGWNINWWRISRVGTSAQMMPTDPEVLAEELETLSFEVYPNPGVDGIRLGKSDPSEVYTITDSGGSVRFEGKSTDGRIDVSQLPHGIYHISILREGKRISRRFIKN
jgi:beta-glucanase (GH16 family)